jgi:hypothetical protein
LKELGAAEIQGLYSTPLLHKRDECVVEIQGLKPTPFLHRRDEYMIELQGTLAKF